LSLGPFKMMLDHIDDQVALDRRWVHKLYHAADDAGFGATAAVLKEVQGLLDEVRAQLAEAHDAFDKDSAAADGVTVSLV
ncbi:MAG: hypothetical protein LBB46_03750, partial [Coriobacteriaceae bacterium]|jgi:hypothetical protein|nr:hypothetical protein [Coriobacteriaceae bacterium]